MSGDILKKLYGVLQARKNADAGTSYVASLYRDGPDAIIAKIREETEEMIAEILQGDAQALRAESADLLFHLLVLWADRNIDPDEILAILDQRFGQSGLAEKASRK